MEDDLFFADLSKQISLLIMEEEDVVEEEPAVAPYWHHASSLQGGFTGAVNNPAARSPAPVYDQMNSRREISKGTGVFIPKSSQPRRKNRQRRFSSSSRSHSHRQDSDHEHSSLSRSGPSQFPHKNSFHPKKF